MTDESVNDKFRQYAEITNAQLTKYCSRAFSAGYENRAKYSGADFTVAYPAADTFDKDERKSLRNIKMEITTSNGRIIRGDALLLLASAYHMGAECHDADIRETGSPQPIGDRGSSLSMQQIGDHMLQTPDVKLANAIVPKFIKPKSEPGVSQTLDKKSAESWGKLIKDEQERGRTGSREV